MRHGSNVHGAAAMNSKTESKLNAIANSVITKLLVMAVAALSMPIASLLVAAGMYWLSQQFEPIHGAIKRIDSQILEMGDRDDAQQRTLEAFRSALQDHESRLVNGKANRDRQAEQNAFNFEKIDKKLETITDKIGDVNGAIIGLRTTINERVPPKRNSLSEVAP
jgi:hypothetical protein